jgi:hypothetical protein
MVHRILLSCLALCVCVLGAALLAGCATSSKNTNINPETLDVTGLWVRDPQASFDAMFENLKQRGNISDDIKPNNPTLKMMRGMAGLDVNQSVSVRLDPDGSYTQTMKALPEVNAAISARWERTSPTMITVLDNDQSSRSGNITLEIMPNGTLRLNMGNIIYVLKKARE